MICVLLYIKNTNVPFFWKYNTLTKFMFCRPQEGTVWSEAFNFFNQLGFAFIASFVFYLFVDYFPKRRRCQSVFGLISEKVETIDRLFGELFSFLMFIYRHSSSKKSLCFAIPKSPNIHIRIIHYFPVIFKDFSQFRSIFLF